VSLNGRDSSPKTCRCISYRDYHDQYDDRCRDGDGSGLLFGQVQIIFEISVVLLIGLIFDIMNTWLTNAALIKWYVLRSGGK